MTNAETATEASATDVKTETVNFNAQIVRQVEHYFGDYNLPRDKFLKEAVDKADDGWIDMETMMKFKRLATLAKEGTNIVDALKEAKSELVEVNEAGDKIRRNPAQAIPEWNEERKKALQEQTAYVKGFHKENTELDPLLKYFEQFPGVLNVQMRNFTNKKTNLKGFKGSVFVTFKDKACADAYMALEKVEGPEGSDEIIRKWQLAYFEEKTKEVEEKRKNDKANKEKVKAARDEGKSKDEDTKDEKVFDALPKGAVLFLKNLTGEDTSREDIVSVLEADFGVNKQESIAFIYFQRGETEAKLRFKTENAAVELEKRMLEKKPEKKIEVKGATEVEFSVLEGEDETAFLEKCVVDMKAHRGKGGSRGGHKRRGGFNRGGPHAKRGRR